MSLYPNLKIVLVNTTLPANIGSVARAMKNMEIEQLCLVAPARPLDENAFNRSAGALDILDNAQRVATLDEALVDQHIVIGTSARNRKLPWPMLNPRECAVLTHKAKLEGKNVAILFGREDRGLTNDELQRCNFHVTIPSNEAFSSLNLSAAVQVICYEMKMLMEMQLGEGRVSTVFDFNVDLAADLASQENIELFYEHLESTLSSIEFLDKNNPRQLMNRLRRLYNRSHLEVIELNILRGILTAVDKKAGE